MNRLRVNALHYCMNFILVAFVDSTISSIVRNPAFDVPSRQILMRHNFYRQIHDSKPLTLDKKLCEEASELAQNMAEMDQPLIASGINVFSAKFGNPKQDRDEGVGYLNSVDSWYQEVRFYRDEETKGLTSNFTQLVWNASERLGVGTARSDSNTLYVVCKYDPPGNVDDAYARNVFKRRGDDYSRRETFGSGLRFEAPYLVEEPKTNFTFVFDVTDYPAVPGTDTIVVETSPAPSTTVPTKSSVRSRKRDDRSRARIAWWLVFESVAEEVRHLLWPDSEEAHSIEKRETYIPELENVDETIGSELDSLLPALSVDNLRPSSENDYLADSVAKVHSECCQEERDACEEELPKKCVCQRLTQIEIISRKVDMVLVFVVFNNIFMIIFGVAVTLGVVVQWCTGPGMNSKRRRR